MMNILTEQAFVDTVVFAWEKNECGLFVCLCAHVCVFSHLSIP